MSYVPPPPDQPPAPGAPPPGYPAPRTDTKAALALVLGISSVLLGWCCFVFGVPGVAAIILGRRSERDIAAHPGALTGSGMARAGFILGIVGTVLTVISLVLNVLYFTGDTGRFEFFVDPR